MYKNVLVPLDGSKRAEAILPHVEQLARNIGAKVILMRVIEPEPVLVTAEPIYTHSELGSHLYQLEQAEAYLASWCGEFREKGIAAKHLVSRGGPVIGEIIKAADREEVDLIALASHGRTGLSRVLFGSVAAGILHRVDRPLLVVRSLEEENLEHRLITESQKATGSYP